MIDPQAERISFFEDQASQHWRYPADQYARLSIEAGSAGYVVVKKGSEDRYVRACQWRLDSGQPSFSVVATLVRMARATKAPGVRWAIYGDDAHTARLVSRIRKLGFLCVRRVRTLLVRSKSEELRSPENWNLTDSLFSFDP